MLDLGLSGLSHVFLYELNQRVGRVRQLPVGGDTKIDGCVDGLPVRDRHRSQQATFYLSLDGERREQGHRSAAQDQFLQHLDRTADKDRIEIDLLVAEDILDRLASGKAALGKGERVIHTAERPAFLAKNRYDLPETLPLDWQAFAAAMPHDSL